MAHPIGLTVTNIQKAMNMQGPDNEALIYSVMNEAYFDMCAMIDWAPLRRKAEFSIAENQTTGALLPSNLVDIKRVVDSDDTAGIMAYARSQESEQYQYTGGKRWFYMDARVAPLVDRAGVTINKNSVSFMVDPALSNDYVGEYIRFGSAPGVYEITAAYTIGTKYRGPSIVSSDEVFQIRPEHTKRFLAVQADGTAGAGDVTVFYWVMPEPLYSREQVPVLPTNAPIELKTMMILMRDHQKKLSSKRDIAAEYDDNRGNGAWPEAVALNPSPSYPIVTRDRTGRRAYFGRRR